jgi:hypothetical protein
MLIIRLKKENQFEFLCKCNEKLFCIRKVSKIFWTLYQQICLSIRYKKQ